MKKLGRVELHMMLEYMRTRTSSDRYRAALKQAEDALNAAHELRLAMLQMQGAIDDFVPNVGRCVIHDYRRLNDARIAARAAVGKLNELYRPVDMSPFEIKPYTCRCGQVITDGKECGCGARY